MAQSVKLSDGSYIDASAVYDTDRQETVEDALKVSTVYLKPYIVAAGNYAADSLTRVEKQGRMVSLIFTARSNNAEIAAKSVWCTLPEGYRPKAETVAIARLLFSDKSGVYATILADGTIRADTSIAAQQWWGFTVSYLTD